MATFTSESVAALADEVEASPSKLLTISNPKTLKGQKRGYVTAGLHLSPARSAGFEVCAHRTDGCTIACLTTAGRGSSLSDMGKLIHVARIRRTKWFRSDRQAFMTQLHTEIAAFVRSVERKGFTPCVRLNVLSDIPWENVKYTRPDGTRGSIIDAFPSLQFYDYTKYPDRGQVPANYDLTFSLADGNEDDADYVIRHGGRVAVVFRNVDNPKLPARFWKLPNEWNGFPLVDADEHDLRFLEPQGVYCGLKAKGHAWKDTTGFVHDIDPA